MRAHEIADDLSLRDCEVVELEAHIMLPEGDAGRAHDPGIERDGYSVAFDFDGDVPTDEWGFEAADEHASTFSGKVEHLAEVTAQVFARDSPLSAALGVDQRSVFDWFTLHRRVVGGLTR